MILLTPNKLLEVLLLVLESCGLHYPSAHHESARMLVTFMGLRRLRILMLSAAAESLCRDYSIGAHSLLFCEIMGIPEDVVGTFRYAKESVGFELCRFVQLIY